MPLLHTSMQTLLVHYPKNYCILVIVCATDEENSSPDIQSTRNGTGIVATLETISTDNVIGAHNSMKKESSLTITSVHRSQLGNVYKCFVRSTGIEKSLI